MSLRDRTVRSWKGAVYLAPAAGLFRGAAGDNVTHAHGAHQLSVGLHEMVSVETAARVVRGRAVFIPAGCSHRLRGGTVLSVYTDPLADLGRAMQASTASLDSPSAVADELSVRMVAHAGAARELTENLVAELGEILGAPIDLRPDALLVRCSRALAESLRGGAALSRAELAALAGTSEGRFSHWFRQRTGMPMQTYRRWLRVTLAVEFILTGESMVAAAHHAGFADQAHFVRTFRVMFGINPTAALGQINQAR